MVAAGVELDDEPLDPHPEAATTSTAAVHIMMPLACLIRTSLGAQCAPIREAVTKGSGAGVGRHTVPLSKGFGVPPCAGTIRIRIVEPCTAGCGARRIAVAQPRLIWIVPAL